jgi:hypothetical protein
MNWKPCERVLGAWTYCLWHTSWRTQWRYVTECAPSYIKVSQYWTLLTCVVYRRVVWYINRPSDVSVGPLCSGFRNSAWCRLCPDSFQPIMKLEAKIISETSVFYYQTTRRHGPADGRLRIYGRENSSFHSFRSCLNDTRTVLGIRTYSDNAVYPDICGQCVLSIRKLADSFFHYIQTHVVFSLCIQKLWILCPVYPDICNFVLCIRTDSDNVFSLSGYLQTYSLFPDIHTL